MQITRENYSQYANMIQQMLGGKKGIGSPYDDCDYRSEERRVGKECGS